MKYSSLLLSCIIVLCVSVPNSFAAGTLIVSGPPKHRLLSGMNIKKLVGVGPDIVKSILTELPLFRKKGSSQDKCLIISWRGTAKLLRFVIRLNKNKKPQLNRAFSSPTEQPGNPFIIFPYAIY
ncbi:MAG TPA: hypothetical protein EYH19_01825 [Desulfocapsa sulfexigens]|nr:hypothetical protein [Desulfocapsa sulfexigens]